MRHKTPRFVVCLPLTSVCLYHILPAPQLFLCWLLSPHLSFPALIFGSVSSLCPISLGFFNLSHILFILLLFCSFPLCHSGSYVLLLSISFSSLFSSLFCSARPQHDLPFSAFSSLWCWPVQKWTLQNNFHNPPPATLTKIYVSGRLAVLLIGVSGVRWCVCVCLHMHAKSPFMLALFNSFFGSI